MTMTHGFDPRRVPPPVGPPPPPRRSGLPGWVTSLIVIGAVVVAALVLLMGAAAIIGAAQSSPSPASGAPSGASSSSSGTTAGGHQVEVVIDSSEPTLRQIMSQGPMGSGQESNVPTPFRYPLTTSPGVPYATTVGVLGPLKAQRGAWVRCTITVDGQVASQQVGVNGYPASCSVQLTQ